MDDSSRGGCVSSAQIKSAPVLGTVNVAYLHETARISGAEQSLLNLVCHLDRKKFNPYFVLSEKGALGDKLGKLGVPVIIISFPQIRRIRGVCGALCSLVDFFKVENIGLAHSNSIRTHLYGSIAAKYCGIPSVWHQRNMLRGEIVDPDRLLSFLPDRIICNSEAIARRFATFGRIPEKVTVVYNGVDTQTFNPSVNRSKVRQEFGIRSDQIVVGIASRMNAQKGHETFLRAGQRIIAESMLTRDKVRFMIIGAAVFDDEKNRESRLRGMAEELGIKDIVVFTGHREDMPEVYAAIDIFVLASDAEACGRVVLEAMACAKPIVATDSGGTPEAIENNKDGVLFHFGDEKTLADKIVFMVNNPDFRQKISLAARKMIEEKFTIQAYVRVIESLYTGLAKG